MEATTRHGARPETLRHGVTLAVTPLRGVKLGDLLPGVSLAVAQCGVMARTQPGVVVTPETTIPLGADVTTTETTPLGVPVAMETTPLGAPIKTITLALIPRGEIRATIPRAGETTTAIREALGKEMTAVQRGAPIKMNQLVILKKNREHS